MNNPSTTKATTSQTSGTRQERQYFYFGKPTGKELSADEFADKVCGELVKNGSFSADGKCLLGAKTPSVT